MRKEIIKQLKQYQEEMKTVQKKKVSTQGDGFLHIDRYEITLPQGQIIFREQLIKGTEDGSAVIIFPVTREGKILLAIEPRVFTKETVGVGLPAGYQETGEDVLTAAKRELLEETGYQATNMIILDQFYQDEGCSSAYNTIVLAYDCHKVGHQQLDQDEFVRYIECTKEEAYDILKQGYILGGNAKLAFEKAKTYLYRKENKDEI